MDRVESLLAAVTDVGLLPVLPVAIPLAGMLAAIVVGGRAGAVLALIAHAATVIAVVFLVGAVIEGAGPVVLYLGDWAPPLGIALRADGLAAAVLAVGAAVVTAVAIQATGVFWPPAGGESRASFAFWPLLLALWAALATVVLAGDLFTLHVAIELLTFAAVPLLCLDGSRTTLQAALRYLLFALLGSMLYLSGVVLLYGLHGTLDIRLLSEAVEADWPTVIAASLMTVGLVAKTALVPLHLWLPPAHAGAPAVVSALLSALVVKGGFIVLLRLWFDVMPGLATAPFVALLGGLGLAAIVLGSLLALQQVRLKQLIAYSTVAQIGYLFVAFPLAFDVDAGRLVRGETLAATVLQVSTHAAAKAALFLAAGLIVARTGSDAMSAVQGMGRRMPTVALSVGVALFALSGLPPGGVWAAKALGAPAGASWPWAQALTVGGALTAGYLAAALAILLRRPASDAPAGVSWRGTMALGLAVLAMTAGMLPLQLAPAPLVFPDPAAFLDALAPIAAGLGIAVLLGQATAGADATGRVAIALGAVRRACRAMIGPFVSVDAWLGRWPAASLALLVTLAAVVLTLADGLS